MKLCGHHWRVHINGFQTTLAETTQARAKGSTQSHIVQTVSNLKQTLPARGTVWGDLSLPESIRTPYLISSTIVPNFEICNIK